MAVPNWSGPQSLQLFVVLCGFISITQSCCVKENKNKNSTRVSGHAPSPLPQYLSESSQGNHFQDAGSTTLQSIKLAVRKPKGFCECNPKFLGRISRAMLFPRTELPHSPFCPMLVISV